MPIWVFDSIALFLASVVMYLFIRKGQVHNISVTEYLLAMFAIPLIGYTWLIYNAHGSIAISWPNLAIIFLAAVFLSYIGNILSQTSILQASNPGYSLTITKSYVVFTTLFAVFFFHSSLTFTSTVAICLILVFSALITISPQSTKKPSNKNNKWAIMAIGAFFCFSFLTLVSVYIIHVGVPVYVYLFYLFLFVTICLVSEAIINKRKITLGISKAFILLIIGSMSLLYNLYTQLGYTSSPNPGYINAASAASITLITLLSSFFFKDELTKRKFIGVVGVTAGLVLLFIKT